MPALETMTIQGFKSIRSAQVDLHPLNILIGANGSGKSNFVGVFRFLSEIVRRNLALSVGRAGGPDSFLYFGQKTTESLHLRADFAPRDGRSNAYSCTLIPSTDGAFVFKDEFAYFQDRSRGFERPFDVSLGSGHLESRLETERQYQAVARYVLDAMRSWRIYHFHDTSDSAKIKQIGDINDNRFLHSDAGNLAAYLFLLRETKKTYYQKIVGAIRLVAPFFDDFALRRSPLNPETIRLEWFDKGSTSLFGPHALSDGTLRFMALATLLLQPADAMPSIILLDEPELGLHPYPIVMLASMLRAASRHTQVIVSTQSVTLVNQFSAEDILVVDREEGQSVFRRLSQEQVDDWLDEYGLGELWEKNLLGGRPTA